MSRNFYNGLLMAGLLCMAPDTGDGGGGAPPEQPPAPAPPGPNAEGGGPPPPAPGAQPLAPQASPAQPAAPHVAGTGGHLPHHRDKQKRLTRAGMESVLADGGSVLHNGQIITQVTSLPCEAELADDPHAQEQAQRRLDEQQAEIDRQRAILTRKPDPAPAPSARPAPAPNRPQGQQPQGNRPQGGNPGAGRK